MNEREETYADKMLAGMAAELCSGLDWGEATETNRDIQAALKTVVKELAGRNLKEIKTTDLPKHIQALVKAQDENTRLLQLLDGRADSRPDGVGAGIPLKGLTDEQLRTVLGWTEMARGDGA